MAEELRLKSQGRVEEVEALMAKRTFPKKNNKKGNLSSNNSKATNKSDKPKGKCFKCGKGGHWKRDCRKQNSSGGKRDDSSVEAFVCNKTTNGDNETWILDSGATHHMSHRREWFENFIEISEQVKVGNGDRIVI